MNRAQKIARFNLIVILIALSLSTIAVGVLYFVVGMPMRRALSGFGFIGICGLMGLSPLLYKKEGDKVSFDERDRLYNMRAWFAGYCLSYLFFVVVCMTTWFIYGFKGTISVNVLPLTVLGGYMALILAHSLAILVQYDRTNRGDKS